MRRKTAIAAVLALCLLLAGCGTSQSFRGAVHTGFPAVAQRLDGYQATEEAALLRQAAQDPVRLETAEPAWNRAAPVYREKVKADAGLWDLRRQQWLTTADELDDAMKREHAYRQKATGTP
jgi:hypothetical protein